MSPATAGIVLAAAAAGILVIARGVARARDIAAIAWMPVLSRRLARWVRRTDYSGEAMLSADGAGAALVERRRRGLDRLSAALEGQHPLSTEFGRELRNGFSDLRFTDACRVPFPFAQAVQSRFNLCSVVTASRGPYLQSLDGGWTLDVSGAYGLNVAGFDRYKAWLQTALDRVRDLGPVLGPIHPVVADNVALLKRVSGQDEVSFHMSGTEAVMAAVRLARFNTGRRLIVCFSGAYHGWWDGVQPGLGSERAIGDCLTLRDLHEGSLGVIRRRAREIAAVLVNPVQSFHPNAPPPNDAVLLTSDARSAGGRDQRYGDWLRRLSDTCRAANVPLVLDEVYTGFRLAAGGAQAYFGVSADMVVYGKTVAGGLPIGVVCGRHRLMRRIDPDRPMRMAYVVGTFSAHPLVMASMNEFLRWVTQPATADQYALANRQCTEWAHGLNEALAEASLPVRVVNLGTIWTVLFKEPSRFNWLLQYYLRAEGLTLSWVGTGRCLTSMDFSDAEFDALSAKVLGATRAMRADGWWPTAAEFPRKDVTMRKRLFGDLFQSLFPVPASARAFYTAVMQRKEDDHHASHTNAANQYLHIVSSSAFIICYAIIAKDLRTAMFVGVTALLVRQFGHAVLEPACHDAEALLLGYSTPRKTMILAAYCLVPVAVLVWMRAWTFQAWLHAAQPIALAWFVLTLAVVFGRVAFLMWTHGFRIAMIWLVKLVTDPVTDLIAYVPELARRA